MVQSGTPCWASWPEQACQCRVLFTGTTELAACDALPACCVLPDGGVLPAAGPEDMADPEQAVTPSRAATVAASTATAPRGERAPRRDIDMPSIMPGASRCLARSRREPLAGGNGNGQEAEAR